MLLRHGHSTWRETWLTAHLLSSELALHWLLLLILLRRHAHDTRRLADLFHNAIISLLLLVLRPNTRLGVRKLLWRSLSLLLLIQALALVIC